jgi:hypothetical protein
MLKACKGHKVNLKFEKKMIKWPIVNKLTIKDQEDGKGHPVIRYK